MEWGSGEGNEQGAEGEKWKEMEDEEAEEMEEDFGKEEGREWKSRSLTKRRK